MLPSQTTFLAPAPALRGLYVDTGIHDLEVPPPGQARPGARDHAPRELAVDGNRISEAHTAPLEGVKRQTIDFLQPSVSALDEVEVWEVAVE